MHGNSHHVGGICGCGEVAGQALLRIVVGCRHQKQTLCVIAAGCTDCIHKRLVQRHDLRIGDLDLVHILKDQLLVIVLEVGCDLLPQVGELALCGSIEPACLVVGVDDAVQAVIQTVIHNGLNPGKICVHVHLALHCLVPGHRDPDGLEASLLDLLDHGLGGKGIAPGSFDLLRREGTRVPGVGGAEGITQVPAKTHVLHHIDGGGVCSRHVDKAACKCACQRHAQSGSGHSAEQLFCQLHVILLPFFYMTGYDEKTQP